MRRSRGPAGPVDRVTTRPRVGLLHYTGPPVIGGVETILYEQAVRLAARGYPITILSGRGGPPPDAQAGKRFIIPPLDSPPPHGNSPRAAPYPGQVPPEIAAPQTPIEHPPPPP